MSSTQFAVSCNPIQFVLKRSVFFVLCTKLALQALNTIAVILAFDQSAGTLSTLSLSVLVSMELSSNIYLCCIKSPGGTSITLTLINIVHKVHWCRDAAWASCVGTHPPSGHPPHCSCHSYKEKEDRRELVEIRLPQILS